MSAWNTYYKRGVGSRFFPFGKPDPVQMTAYGVKAIKNELIYRGYQGDIVDNFLFGSATEAQTKLFQDAMGLQVDGVVGPITARSLFKARVATVEHLQNIPDNLLCKLISLESAYDPGAIGTADPLDHGLLQINLHFHPDVTERQSANPAFSIPWGGKGLATAFGSFGDWDVAVASWNVGYVAAHNWQAAGKPADGSTASKYVQLVRAQAC